MKPSLAERACTCSVLWVRALSMKMTTSLSLVFGSYLMLFMSL